jgi:hypothetical protein
MCMHEFVVKSFISLLVRVVALLRYSQYILFAPAVGLFCGPLFRMWEKMLKIEGKNHWLRSFSRLFVFGLLFWFQLPFLLWSCRLYPRGIHHNIRVFIIPALVCNLYLALLQLRRNDRREEAQATIQHEDAYSEDSELDHCSCDLFSWFSVWRHRVIEDSHLQGQGGRVSSIRQVLWL